MPSPQCAECTNSLQIRVDLSSTQLSEIERTLRTEFGPSVMSSEKAEELKEILAMADKDIEDHESEVARLRDKLRVLETQKLQLETQRAKLRSLLSPIRKLPNETLLHILQYVCEKNILEINSWATDEDTPEYRLLPTVAISYVCSRWRILALSSPSLWANIEVKMGVNSSYYKGGFTQIGEESMVARYLERSGDWPLRLALAVRPMSSTKTPIPDLFMRHAYRWKTFKYFCGPPMAYKTLAGHRFPLLSKVDIDRAVTSSDLDCFEHSPRLCAFTSRTTPRSQVLCNQIEDLKLHGGLLSSTELAEILHSCPSLKSLEITDIRAYNVDLEKGTLGTWRNITSLTFGDDLLKKVFSLFNFPSLNKLVMGGQYVIHWPAGAFSPFVSRLASCVITHLTLRRQSMSDLDLIAALQVMPDLLHLEISNYGFPNGSQKHIPITSHLLSSLTQQHQSTSVSLVPKLHSLFLEHVRADFDDHAFIRMVESRWVKPGSALSKAMSTMGKACIRSIVLKCKGREVDAEIYEPLRILDVEGLRVVVSGTNGVQV